MPRRSKVEIGPFLARHYDLAMDLLLLGRYRRFLRNALLTMQIEPGEEVLDLGSGTGRNASLMMDALGQNGRLIGVDISEEMLRQSRRRCRAYPHVAFLKARIEEPLGLHEEFDKACLFFVLHGFEDIDKKGILANAQEALKAGGTLWILDYAKFALDELWFPLRWAFTHVECELATEFLNLELEDMLQSVGFRDFVSHPFFWRYIRLLEAHK